MPERYADVDGTTVRVGSAADAGALCPTADGRPRTAKEYQWLVKYSGAPGPVMIPNPLDPTARDVPLINPVTRMQEYPLDEVAVFQAGRRGRGRQHPGRSTPEALKRTEWRERLLVAARNGRLAVESDGRVTLDGERLAARPAQLCGDLLRSGVIGEPGDDARLPLTDAGRAVLTRWGVEPAST